VSTRATDPVTPESQEWARTVRRAAGSPHRGLAQRHDAGPWHALTATQQAWCGRRPLRFAHQSHPPGTAPDGPLCERCVRALAAGQVYGTTWRRRG
jgi:hypothetical protein